MTMTYYDTTIIILYHETPRRDHPGQIDRPREDPHIVANAITTSAKAQELFDTSTTRLWCLHDKFLDHNECTQQTANIAQRCTKQLIGKIPTKATDARPLQA